MDEPASNGNPQPGMQGEISARLAAGKFILQVGLPEGALVQLAAPDDLVEPSMRSVPLSELPPRIDFWLDREREFGLIALAMQASGSGRIELYGPPGVGKTALLSYLTTHPLSSAFPDGAVYLSACHQPFPDLLQSLFEIFCQSPLAYRPDDSQVRRSLAGLKALIILDDASLTAEEIRELTGAAPGCTFILATTERRLWDDGESLELAGLPMEDALALFENGLGRPLEEEERVQAYSLAAGLGGRPLHILQASALARETGRSVLEISNPHSQIPLIESIQKQLLEGLTEVERTAIFCLASLQGAATTPDHLAALTGQPDILPVLERLAAFSLAELSAGRCSLAGGMDELVLNTWDLTEWKFHALVYYTRWSETQPLGSDQLRKETNVLLGLHRWAAGTQHWREALRLVRSLEGTLSLSGHWEAWRQALQIGMDAARALGIPAAEAWALHQLGTRLLCLGQAAQARAALIQALRLRQSLRDRPGELATQGNLAILLQQKSKPLGGLAAFSLPESESSLEETRPIPIPPSSPGRSILPVAVVNLLTPAKTPSRRSGVLIARILLLALILLVPTAFLGRRYLRPESTAGPPTGTPFVLAFETQVPVVETPGAILYLPILPNLYNAPDEQGTILPETGSSPEPSPASLFPPYTIVPPTPSP